MPALEVSGKPTVRKTLCEESPLSGKPSIRKTHHPGRARLTGWPQDQAGTSRLTAMSWEAQKPHMQKRLESPADVPSHVEPRRIAKNGFNRKKNTSLSKMFFLVSHEAVKFLYGQIVRVESITLHAFCLET